MTPAPVGRLAGIVGITGSPGTGKKTISPLVAKELRLDCLSLNEFASSQGLLKRGEAEGTVDTGEMRSKLAPRLAGPGVAYGHLLPYVVGSDSVEKVAVLRCEPKVLKRRLLARGYPPRKVAENVEAELIGVVSADAYEAFGGRKTFEVDTTRSSPRRLAGEISAVVLGAAWASPRIDWTTRYDSGAKLRSLLSVA